VSPRFVVPLEEHPHEVLFLPEASAGDWACILGRATLWSMETGDVLVEPGEVDRTLWFLAEGALDVFDGDRLLKSIEAPSVVGEVGFLDGGPRSARVVAKCEAEVARFDESAFEALLVEDAGLACRFALDLGRVAALRLRAMEAAERA
jgi:CRP/FNR family cyclic AMP-dependent transcriptional regulator